MTKYYRIRAGVLEYEVNGSWYRTTLPGDDLNREFGIVIYRLKYDPIGPDDQFFPAYCRAFIDYVRDTERAALENHQQK